MGLGADLSPKQLCPHLLPCLACLGRAVFLSVAAKGLALSASPGSRPHLFRKLGWAGRTLPLDPTFYKSHI